MPRIQFPFTANLGVVKDVEPHRLPAGVWSDGINMFFKDDEIAKAFGYIEYISSPVINAKSIFFCPLHELGYWIYANHEKAYAFNIDGTLAEITRASGDYTGGVSDRWNFSYLHGVGIINHGANDPQLWNPPSLATQLVDLPNWPASTTCKVMRSFGNYLIALDVTKSGTRHGSMIKWSHPALPGQVPSSWDETDATKDAGEYTLSETSGLVLDCLPLGGTNIIYKEDSVYAMTPIGGQLIFGFHRLPFSFGLLTQDCIVELERQHFIVTDHDIVIHDGINAQSILDKRNLNFIFDNLFESGGRTDCYAFYYHSRNEIWFCFPETGSTVPNIAAVWEVSTGAMSFRDLPSVPGVSYTYPMRLAEQDEWGKDAQTWGGETSLVWDDAQFVNIKERIVFINGTDGTIDQFDKDVYTAKGVNERSFIERQSMGFAYTDQSGEAVVDLRSFKFIQEVWPLVDGVDGTVIKVYMGLQDDPEGTITWLDPVDYILGTTDFLPVYRSCRFFSIRFEATSGVSWDLHGFSYDLELGGTF